MYNIAKSAGWQMRNAVEILDEVFGGDAPSKLAVYSRLRSRKNRYSNMYMSNVITRCISAGYMRLGNGRGNAYRLIITDKGRELLQTPS